MKKISLLLVFILSGLPVFAQIDSSYSMVLLHQSQNIFHFPVWGETDNDLYLNESFQWLKYDLSDCTLNSSYYDQHELGINTAANYSKVNDRETTNRLKSDTLWKPRQVFDKRGNKVSLEIGLMESAFLINDRKVTGINGNAHSLAISPSGRYVACIFELAGLMVIDLQKELEQIERTDKMLAEMDMLAKADYFLSVGDIKSFGKTLEAMSEKEREQVEYNYFVGTFNYLTHNRDQTKIDLAIQHLTMVAEDSRFYNSNGMLAELYRIKKNWAKAFEYAKVAIKRTPKFYLGYSVLGDYYTKQGETKTACKYYKKSVKFGDPMGGLRLMNCE